MEKDSIIRQHIIVLSGNYKEFCDYVIHEYELLKHSQVYYDRHFIYGGSIGRLWGLVAWDVVVVGSFWEREDSEKLFEYARTRIRPRFYEKQKGDSKIFRAEIDRMFDEIFGEID